MTLATRCPACGTSFRVVEDQLKVSEGWVRCGRCNEVFNAIESLFDTDAEPVAPALIPFMGAPAAPLPAWPPPAPTSEQASPAAAPTPEEAPEQESKPGTADDVQAPRMASSMPDALLVGMAEPSFMRAADRAASWDRPHMRRAMAVGAVFLALVLAAQVALLHRDLLAARWPASRPALEAACAGAGCTVERLRRIASLAVDASGLNQTDGSTVYRLSAVLRNRGDVELLLPALDLVLTNAQGGIVARRVLDAAELGSTSRTLAAGGELALQANINTGERRVSGYTIEIFYP